MFDLKGWQTAREETRDTRREENTFRGDFFGQELKAGGRISFMVRKI